MTARPVAQVEREQAEAYRANDLPRALALHNERMALAIDAQNRAGIVFPSDAWKSQAGR